MTATQHRRAGCNAVSAWLWPHAAFAALLLTVAIPPIHNEASIRGACPHCSTPMHLSSPLPVPKPERALETQSEPAATRTLFLGAVLWGISILGSRRASNATSRTAARDIGGVLLAALTVASFVTLHTTWLPPALLPRPEHILVTLQGDLPELMQAAWRSALLLAGGYGLALVVAVPLGIAVGWNTRWFLAAQLVVKVLGPLPPVVYVPYAIALMPTFRMAAISVVFIGAFWPLFVRTMQGVRLIPRGTIDAARTLNLGTFSMLRRIVLPGTLPAICAGAMLALVFAFVLLTSAELIGASGGISSGLGYYVLYADQIQEQRRVIAGICFIGLAVTVIVFAMNRIEARLLRWRD